MCGSGPDVPDPDPIGKPAPPPPPPPPPEVKEALATAPEKVSSKPVSRKELTIKKQKTLGGMGSSGAGVGPNV